MEKMKFVKDQMFRTDLFKEKAKYPVISECPVCHDDLYVTKLVCEKCGTGIEGKFALSKFNYLDTEKLYFIEVFVKNRGNIKAIEKEMNISYPTVKKLLDEVITVLGYNPDQSTSPDETNETSEAASDTPKLSKLEIIEKIQKGEITVTEAAELLKKIK
ncbi:MAG: DUF2089 domain-containing protein [Candidatus Izemoplasmatales bacterium]